MFGLAVKANRRIAKVLNFGIAYGMTEMGVRDNLNKEADPALGIEIVTTEEAAAHLAKWHSLYPGVQGYIAWLVNTMCRTRPPSFTNIFGRTRRIPWVRSHGAEGRRGARQAIASMVQGTANELMKVSMVRVDAEILAPLRASGVPAWISGNVHDEMWIDCPREYAPDVARRAKPIMEDFRQLHPIPVKANGEWTQTTWADKADIWTSA